MPVITGINFREKQLGGYGWKKFGFVVRGKSPSKGDQNTVLLSNMHQENVFMKAFLQNLILRPSCYACPAKAGKSNSDLTIADFWGIGYVHPKFDDDEGIGVVFVNTENGMKHFSSLSTERIAVQYKEAISANKSYSQSVSIPVGRNKFWRSFYKGKTIIYSFNKAITPSISLRIKIKIRTIIKRLTGI